MKGPWDIESSMKSKKSLRTFQLIVMLWRFKIFKLLSLKNSVSSLNVVGIMCSAMTSSSFNPWFSLIMFKNYFPKHKTLIIVSWKLESRKSLRENKLLSSSNSKLDRWIMFLMLHRFTEIINDLESSHSFNAWNNFSITVDESGEPQKTFWMMIYFIVFVTVLTIFMTFNDLRATFVRTVECFQLSLFCRWRWLDYLSRFRVCWCRRFSRMTTRMFSVQSRRPSLFWFNFIWVMRDFPFCWWTHDAM
jgi:hypothetical protein